MNPAYGFIETRGLTAAIEAADAMVKAAKVTIIRQQRVGGALVTVMCEGELAACQSAVDAGSVAAERIGELISAHVIPNPFEDTRLVFGPGSSNSKPGRRQTKPTNPKMSAPGSQSIKKSNPSIEKNDTSSEFLDWLSSQEKGADLNLIAEKLGQDNAGARRIVKELMDDGCIEKVHHSYFFLSKRNNK